MSVVKGKCKWSKLLTPSKEEGPFKSKYSIDLFVDAETREKLVSEGLEPKVTKDTKEEFFQFWTHGKKKDGTANPPIRVIDPLKNKLDEEPGNGSLVKVQYQPIEWEFLKKKGIMGALQGVQVLKLISRNKDEFEEEDVPSEVAENFDDDIPF